MPKFNMDHIDFDSDNSLEFDIEPDEYVGKCTRSDISELLREIKYEFPIIFEGEIENDIDEAVNAAMEERRQEELEETPRTESQRIFNRHLDHLRQEWYSISPNDVKIITILAKKYGVV